jgi:membrane-associated HD superfamily phosphohydrolase
MINQEDEDFKNYSERLRPLAKDASKTANKSDQNLYEIAKVLVEANQKFGEDRKKLFIKLKKETTADLGSSSRNLNKAVKVAGDTRIQKNADRLPNAFSALYSLTSLNDEQFGKLLEDKNVDTKITRDVLLDKVKKIKSSETPPEAEKEEQILEKILKKIPKKYLVVKLNDDIELSDEASKELKDVLLEMTKWSVYEPATSDEKK